MLFILIVVVSRAKKSVGLLAAIVFLIYMKLVAASYKLPLLVGNAVNIVVIDSG